MAVLEGGTHRGRIATGDAVLTRATTVDTKTVKVRLAAFAKAHAALTKAQQAVDAAEEKLAKAQSAVAEADVTQDEQVDALAVALVTAGQPRLSPFRGLSKVPPADLKRLGYATEAAKLRALTANVRKRKADDKALARVCASADKAADAVDAAIRKLGPHAAAVTAARGRRDALALPWEQCFGALKRAARWAEDDGFVGLFDALFRVTAPVKKPAKKTRAKPAPEPTPA